MYPALDVEVCRSRQPVTLPQRARPGIVRTSLIELCKRSALVLVLIVTALLAAGPAFAVDFNSPQFEAVFGFAGAVFKQIDPPTEGLEDNYLIGLGYQRGWGDAHGLLYGLEAGLAGRFGETTSLEAWGGLFARYNFDLGPVRVAPALTFGLSGVTNYMAGGETERIEQVDGDGHLLFYLGPEISVGPTDGNYEVFARLHHRSGAWGTLGGVHGDADVLALGFRSFF